MKYFKVMRTISNIMIIIAIIISIIIIFISKSFKDVSDIIALAFIFKLELDVNEIKSKSNENVTLKIAVDTSELTDESSKEDIK